MVADVDGRWHPGIGDPTVVGWTTVAAYFLAAALAAKAAKVNGDRAEVAPHRRKLIGFWSITAIVLFFLGFNKQLDLQSWLTQVLRDIAKQQGWYEARRQYQVVFILTLAGAGTLTTLAAAVILWPLLLRIGIALLGLGLLGTFLMARAASFHHMDMLLHAGPLPLNWVAELGGLTLIMLHAWFAGRSEGRH